MIFQVVINVIKKNKTGTGEETCWRKESLEARVAREGFADIRAKS